MKKKYQCEFLEHQNLMKVCLFDDCNHVSRLICELCNTHRFHDHNQNNQSHIIDLHSIMKNQEILKDQKQQYHKYIDKMNKLSQEIKLLINNLEGLSKFIKQSLFDYNQYVENLFSIQILLDSQKIFKSINDVIAMKIENINNYNQSEVQKNLKNHIQSIKNKIHQMQNNIDNLNNNNSSIIQLIDASNGQQKVITNAIVSTNNQFVLYTTDKQVYYYDINKQLTKSFNIELHSSYISLIQDNQLLYLTYDDYKFFVYSVKKNFKYQHQRIFQGINLQNILSLTKFMAIIFQEESSEYRIINLKTNKIIFKLQLNDVIDIFYDQDYNTCIIVHKNKINQIQLNYKFKSYQQHIENGSLFKSQYCQQSKQLFVLDQGILTFWDLSTKYKSIQQPKQIKFLLKYSEFFKYNLRTDVLFSMNYEKIMIQNHKGDILQEIEHSYGWDLPFSNFEFQLSSEYIFLHVFYQLSLINFNAI